MRRLIFVHAFSHNVKAGFRRAPLNKKQRPERMLLYISSEDTGCIIKCRRTLKALVRLFVYIGSSESSKQEIIMVHDDNEASLNMFISF